MVIFHGYPRYVSHYHTLETGKEGTLREGPQWTRGPEPWVMPKEPRNPMPKRWTVQPPGKCGGNIIEATSLEALFRFFFFLGGCYPLVMTNIAMEAMALIEIDGLAN